MEIIIYVKEVQLTVNYRLKMAWSRFSLFIWNVIIVWFGLCKQNQETRLFKYIFSWLPLDTICGHIVFDWIHTLVCLSQESCINILLSSFFLGEKKHRLLSLLLTFF